MRGSLLQGVLITKINLEEMIFMFHFKASYIFRSTIASGREFHSFFAHYITVCLTDVLDLGTASSSMLSWIIMWV